MLGWLFPEYNTLDTHTLAYYQSCGIVITAKPITHVNMHTIDFKMKHRKQFNQAGNLMMQRYKSVFPNWYQYLTSFGMIDPLDSTRKRYIHRENDVGNGIRNGDGDGISAWEFIYSSES